MINNQVNDKEKPPVFRPGSKNALFLELATPDELGFSREVSVEEFRGDYEKLKFGNGADFARDDGTLAKYFNVVRHKKGKGNKNTHIQLVGYKKSPVLQKPIPDHLREEITVKDCVVLGTSKPECDHKDGRLDNPRLSDVNRVTLDDFQPLSKAANYAKRQHCVECRDTGIRFDAKRLGYHISQVKGNKEYNGTCVGCYWHDPHYFNHKVSKDFQPN